MRVVALVVCLLFVGACSRTEVLGDYQALLQGKSIPLSRFSEPLRSQAAPDYWALNPLFAGQETNASCSTASALMIINALQTDRNTGTQPRITETDLLNKVNSEDWKVGVASEGTGAPPEDLLEYLQIALKAYGFNYEVKFHTTAKADGETRRALVNHLIQNESSGRDFILINFLQGYVVGDGGAHDHYSVVGAFDGKRELVLILDVDREWYEPYWVPVDTLLHSMTAVDPESDGPRGYFYIRPARR